MGGYGSGIYGSGAKTPKNATEYCKSIDIRSWQRNGSLRLDYFNTSWVDGKGKETGSMAVMPKKDHLILYYELNNEPIKMSVFYEETRTGYGNRKWFKCPFCQKRYAVLYLKGKYFACRKCQDLNYRSSQLSGDMAYYHFQLRKLCRILKAEYDPTSYYPPDKPKGMHWKTYEKLVEQYVTLVNKRGNAWLARARRILK